LGYFFFPLTNFFVLAFLFLIGLLIVLVQLKAISYAYERAGLARRYVFGVLILSLLGSGINIPLIRIGAGEPVLTGKVIQHFGMEYVVPVVAWTKGTLLAVNVGGALVPIGVSIYLLWRWPDLLPKAIAATAAMSLLIYQLATPVKGMGIAVPTLIPPIMAAVVAVLLDRDRAALLAYVSGSLGVLIGADIFNLGVISRLGAPVASIGGAGTFDGIFLTGIIAVLLSCWMGPGCAVPEPEARKVKEGEKWEDEGPPYDRPFKP